MPIESIALMIFCIREAKKEGLSSENLSLCLYELEDCLSDCKTKLVNQTIKILEKHGIYVSGTINDLKKKNINNLKKNFLEKKDKVFKNLSEWSTTMGNDTIWKIGSEGRIYIKREWFENKEEYGYHSK